MSLQDTINTTLRVIQGTVTATVNGVIYLITHFPQVLNNMWEIFKASLRMGQYLMIQALRGLKYIALNLPEIARELYDLTILMLKHLPQVLKFLGYTLPKFLLYDAPKAVIKFLVNHLPAVVEWFVKHLPELIAHGVGVFIGIMYAPFKIGFDLMFGRGNQRPESPRLRTQRFESSLADRRAVGDLDAALSADGLRGERFEGRSDLDEKQYYAPGYDFKRNLNASGECNPQGTLTPEFALETKLRNS